MKIKNAFLFSLALMFAGLFASAFAQAAGQTITLPVGTPSVTMTASANGTQPFTYSWKKDGVTIAGATSAVLTLTNLKLSDAGTHTVTISNAQLPGGGTIAVDQVFSLTVLPPTSGKITTSQP